MHIWFNKCTSKSSNKNVNFYLSRVDLEAVCHFFFKYGNNIQKDAYLVKYL